MTNARREHDLVIERGGQRDHEASVEKVLTGKRKPMRVAQVIEAAIPLATGLKGKTPGQVIYSILDAEKAKADGLVVQTGRRVQAQPEAADAKAAA